MKEHLSFGICCKPQFLRDEHNPADSNEAKSSVSLAVPLGVRFMFSFPALPAINAWCLEMKWKDPLILHSKAP